MKDQIVMSKTNGQLAVAVPLFRAHQSDDIGSVGGYLLALTIEKPIAYLLDMGRDFCLPVCAKFAEQKLEFLGEL